jgi:hypothetical protein
MNTLELFSPDLNLGRPPPGEGCARPIGRRDRHRRRRHPVPRKPSTIAGQLHELRLLVEQVETPTMPRITRGDRWTKGGKIAMPKANPPASAARTEMWRADSAEAFLQ